MIDAHPAFLAQVRLVGRDDRTPVAFLICTLVSPPEQDAFMLAALEAAGFGGDCEYLTIDNPRGNVLDAFAGYNASLSEARGEYVVLAHQDLELAFDCRPVLEERLRELTALDPDWGVCGNTGGVARDRLAIRITDPHGDDTRQGPFPHQAMALDENFIVARRSANLCLSHDLSGYHMYGPDLCLMAQIAGYRCYVIDFHLRHASAGKIDATFEAGRDAFARKYQHAFRSRWFQTSCATVFLSASPRLRTIAQSRLARRLGLTSGMT